MLISDDLLEERSYLSRQLPVMIRNALDVFSPGAFMAAPLAVEANGVRRWVVYREPWKRDVAADFGRTQKYASVAVGSLTSVGGGRELKADIDVLGCAEAQVMSTVSLEGSVLDVVRGILVLLGELIVLSPQESQDLFQPGTESPDAFESYLKGLDILLTLRSVGMELKDPGCALEPFAEASAADPSFESAVTAGLSTALQCLESDRIEVESTLATLEMWRIQRPSDRRVPAVMVELLIGKGRLDEALALLFETNASDPDRDLLRRSADLLVEMGRFSEALPIYRTVEREQHDPVILERISALAQMEGQFDLALSAVRQLTDEIDDRPSLWCRLGWLKDRIGVEGDVWSMFCRAFSLDTAPDVEDLLKLNAVLARRDAEDWFVEFLQHWMPPTCFSLSARVLLGRALRLSGARIAARLCFESIDKDALDGEFQTVLTNEQAALLSR